MMRAILIWFLFVSSPLFAQIPSDVYIDMAGQSGNPITTTILNNGTHNLIGTWSLTATPLNGFYIDSHHHSLHFPTKWNGTIYDGSSSTSIAVDLTNTLKVCQLTISVPNRPVKMSAGMFIGPMPRYYNGTGVPGDLDLVSFYSDTGFAVIQMKRNTFGDYGMRLETDPGGVTTHCPPDFSYIGGSSGVIPGNYYWMTMQWDTSTGTVNLSIFDLNGYSIGTASCTSTTGSPIKFFMIGQNESGSSPGDTITFENILINTNGVFPLGPNGMLVSERQADWTTNSVGVPGGIPLTRSTIFTNFSPGATAGQINTGISQCPSNQVVSLAAGAYYLETTLELNKSGVTVRGAGSDKTLLFPGGATQDLLYLGNAPGWSTGVVVTTDCVMGSSNIVVTATNSMKPGLLLKIDELGDTNLCWEKISWVTNDRVLNQTTYIVAITNTTVTVWPPLLWNFSNSLSAQVHYSSSANVGVAPITMSGYEGLAVPAGTNTTLTHMIRSSGTYGCWLYDVSQSNAPNYHIAFILGCRDEIRHCGLWDSQAYAADHEGIVFGDGTTFTGVCSSLIDDNIFYKQTGAVQLNFGSSGNVVAYNLFADGQLASLQWPGIELNHGAHSMKNLVEGNYAEGVKCGSYWGSGSHNVILRNRLTGWTPTFTNYNSIPVEVNTWNYSNSVIGNIIGSAAFTPTYYSPTNNGYSYANSAVLRLGYPDDGDNNYTGFRPPNAVTTNDVSYDQMVTNSTIIQGNYDTKSAAQVWDSRIQDVMITNSYAFAVAPSWFTLPWPPYNPTNTSAAQIDQTNIPSGLRFSKLGSPSATVAISMSLNSATIQMSGATMQISQ